MIKSEMDRIGFEIISRDNPALIAELRRALVAGATAAEIERKLRQRYGATSTTVNLTICAIHYLEKERAK